MKIWVTGAGGCLGSRVVETVKARGYECLATTHFECPVEDLAVVTRLAQVAGPDAIINCAGCLPGAFHLDMIKTNALGPHILSCLALRGIRVVNMSTDCVFGGQRKALHFSEDSPDPDDLYGRTKLAGEVKADHVLNVRGSFISKEAGFLRWLLHAEDEVEAWDNAEWTGTTADVMAVKLVELAEGDKVGVVHVASPKVTTKGWMVDKFVRELGLPVIVVHKEFPHIHRALAPDVELPDVEEVLKTYAKEIRKRI